VWVRIRVAQNHAPEREILVDFEEIDLVVVQRKGNAIPVPDGNQFGDYALRYDGDQARLSAALLVGATALAFASPVLADGFGRTARPDEIAL
jgi:hypothetical protein